MLYPVGLEVFNVGDTTHSSASLVAYICEDPGNPGSEEWWAWWFPSKNIAGQMVRVSVGKDWKPTRETTPQKKEETEIEALRRVNTLLWKALRSVSHTTRKEYFCWCMENYCCGQQQCSDARAALEAVAQLEKKHGK